MASLKQQTISSVKWTTLQTAVTGIAGPILLLIKARFLSPQEFGHIAVILIVIGLCRLMESFGISQAIIQRDEISVRESSTLFYFNIFLSCLIAIALYFASPIIAAFFSLPDLERYLPVVSIVVLVTGPSLLFRAFLEKNMYFKHLSLIAIARQLVALGATSGFLLFGYGVMGVIYAQIMGAVTATFSIMAISARFRAAAVSFHFNPVELVPFLRFGVFVSAKQLLTFATHRLDEVVIGYFLAPEILGIYHFGKNMLERIRNLMTMSFAKVLFPVFSKLKHKPQRLTFAYQRISRYIAFGAFPVFAGIAVTAHLFVPVIFGAQWTDSVIVFQVFSVAVILLVLTANVSTSLLYSVNKPDLVFYIDVITNSLYFILLFLFASQGMLAVLIAYSCYVAYKTLTLQYYANRQLVEGFFSYFQGLAMPAVSALCMVAAVWFFQLLSAPVMGEISQLAGSIIVGAMVYAFLAWFFARETLGQLRSALVRGEITG
ncbi:MAG: lipopolysaccharide biosynthesis protein [Desulfosalsimonas sp.]